MELYACGFNGHSQLDADAKTVHGPSDVHCFTRVASAPRIGVAYAGWSDTIGRERFDRASLRRLVNLSIAQLMALDSVGIRALSTA